MVKRILVGVDFSEASRKALATAHEWAGRLGLPVTAFHVLQVPAPPLPEAESLGILSADWREKLMEHAVEQLEAWAQPFAGTQLLVKWGRPAEALVAEADADTLLVVASVGHSVFERMLFGGTATKVVKHAPCDVLVVRG